VLAGLSDQRGNDSSRRDLPHSVGASAFRHDAGGQPMTGVRPTHEPVKDVQVRLYSGFRQCARLVSPRQLARRKPWLTIDC
jgi:hypothetical protein